MARISKEMIEEARQMDVLTYLETYEPGNLVREGNNLHCTREHDSLKIWANGSWHWFSRGVGGNSALDYLVTVKEMDFKDAVQFITGQAASLPPVSYTPKVEPPKVFELPNVSYQSDRAISYLEGRGVDRDIIDWCIKTKRLYESYPRHNVVFVGFDGEGKSRYAMQRGCGNSFVNEVSGSDKRFSFGIPSRKGSGTLYVFESAIDLLSFATLVKMDGYDWRSVNMLSLAGVYKPQEGNRDSASLPRSLEQYLSDNPNIYNVITCFDNDDIGRNAAETVCSLLAKRRIAAMIKHPPQGKDYNDYLCKIKGLEITHRDKPDKNKSAPPVGSAAR